jgi:plasmid stability protein
MAILNIKNVPDALYKRLQARARRQRRSVSQEVIQILREATERPQTLSILALRGLGKELWKDLDAAVHVETERSAWD